MVRREASRHGVSDAGERFRRAGMEPNKQRPVQSMGEVRDWERLFIGEIKAGHDSRIQPTRNEASTDLRSVATFLDAYLDRHLRPAGIRSLDTTAGRIKTLKQYF